MLCRESWDESRRGGSGGSLEDPAPERQSRQEATRLPLASSETSGEKLGSLDDEHCTGRSAIDRKTKRSWHCFSMNFTSTIRSQMVRLDRYMCM